MYFLNILNTEYFINTNLYSSLKARKNKPFLYKLSIIKHYILIKER